MPRIKQTRKAFMMVENFAISCLINGSRQRVFQNVNGLVLKSRWKFLKCLKLSCIWILPCLCGRNGLQHRRNSWLDGVYGTNCPIPPGKNVTYNLQVKDQIGSYFYFPSFLFHKAAGGFGGIRIWSRPRIPVPFPTPAGDFTVLAGDWFKKNHYVSNQHSSMLWH